MLMRWLAACGLVVPIADVLVTVGLAALDPDYSHVRQFISELGEDGRPCAAAFNIWCVAYGLLFAGFAVGLGRALGSRAVLAVLLLIAATSAASAVFPCDPGCAGDTPTAKVHILLGYLSIPAIVLAPFLTWRAMRRRPAWRGYGGFSLAAGVLLVVAAGWLAAAYCTGREQWWCPPGVAQRTLYAVQYGWMIVVASRLWLLAGHSN